MKSLRLSLARLLYSWAYRLDPPHYTDPMSTTFTVPDGVKQVVITSNWGGGGGGGSSHAINEKAK